jgi:hypothetical protein
MPRIWSINLGGGSSGGLTGRAGNTAISNGADTASVTFSSSFASTNYALICQIKNTTDASPIFLNIVETTKTTNGFTVTFNAPADSANYVLEYIATDNA